MPPRLAHRARRGRGGALPLDVRGAPRGRPLPPSPPVLRGPRGSTARAARPVCAGQHRPRPGPSTAPAGVPAKRPVRPGSWTRSVAPASSDLAHKERGLVCYSRVGHTRRVVWQ
ncbi:hypothetical protein AA958_02920 [Streptomyces sp. CNQ-509]|nr:hypothetical protein AA958_02920 [Streptomyces sp. CNQ-509]